MLSVTDDSIVEGVVESQRCSCKGQSSSRSLTSASTRGVAAGLDLSHTPRGGLLYGQATQRGRAGVAYRTQALAEFQAAIVAMAVSD